MFASRIAYSSMIAAAVAIAATRAAAQPTQQPQQSQVSLAGSPVVAVRTSAPLRIDGVLNESVWRSAPAATAFVQREPVEGAPATRASDVRVIITDDAVVIGARLTDESAAARPAAVRDSGGHAFPDDYFEVQIDAHRAHLTALAFAISPSGAKRSWIVSKDGTRDESWAVEWQAATHVDKQGWSVEIRIPLSQLHVSPGSEQWGVQFVRFSNARQETDVFVYDPPHASAVGSK